MSALGWDVAQRRNAYGELRYDHRVRWHQRVLSLWLQASAPKERGGAILKKFTTREIVYMALLISLSIVLTRILSIRVPLGGVEGVRIGLGGLPIILASVTFGPLAGGIVGALADVLGYMINPMGAYMPHFTLTSFLTGFIPGLIVVALRNNLNYGVLLFAIAVGQIITAVILVPYFIVTLFGAPLLPILIPRIVTQAIQIPLYAFMLRALLAYTPLHLVKAV